MPQITHTNWRRTIKGKRRGKNKEDILLFASKSTEQKQKPEIDAPNKACNTDGEYVAG